MARYYGAGNTVKHTPGGDLVAGAVIVADEKILIAKNDMKSGVEGDVDTNGQFYFPKTAATVYTQGKPVYWDVADGDAQETSDTGTNKKIGYVAESALSADTEVLCQLVNNNA